MTVGPPPPESSLRTRLFAVAGRLFGAGDAGTFAWFAAALLIVTLGGLAASLAPLALKALVDRVSVPGGAAAAAPLAGLVGLYVAALLFQRLCEQLQAYAHSRGEQRLVRRFGAQAYAHMLTLPLGFHLDNKSGALAQALTQGLMGLRLIVNHLVLTLAPVIVQLVVAGVVLAATLGPGLGLILFAALAAYSAVFGWGVGRLHESVQRLSAAQVDAGGAAADGLMNVEAIKAFTAETRFADRYDQLLGQTEDHWRGFLSRRLANGVAVAGVFGLAVGLVTLLAGRQVAEGRLTLGAFVLINTYLLQLVRPLELLGFAVRDIGQGVAFLDRIAAILREPAETQGPAAAPPPPARPADLEFRNVSFGFGERRTLQDVSFHAPPGALIGVVGPSGAGKSSLLRLILRFYEPRAGLILLDGQPLSGLPVGALRRQIALVSQDTILFNDTIGANIRFAVDTADAEDLAAAAQRARLSEFLAELPDGLDTLVGERGLKLSGGEKQRVSIARAALKQARLVIFDEATAALDPATERAVWQAMSGLAQGATTLVVTHRLSTVAGADEILVLDHGRIVERGSHRQLLDLGGLYARLWRAQTTGAFHSAAGADDPSALASSA